MRLSILLNELFPLPAQAEREIACLTLDSRKVEKDDLFIAVKGALSDGCQYIQQAIQRGATAVLIDASQLTEEVSFQQGIPLIPIQNLKQQIGSLAARFYDYPAKKLRMIGVTGTNGKTSCAHYIAQALQAPCGVIGTLGSGVYGALGEAGLTTPDAITLQALLHQFVVKGVKTVVMEVSSHSIDQGRINGIEFEIGIFTNLTQDHLDYHGTLEAYAAVKYRFLTAASTQQVIINDDDPYGKKWINKLAEQKSVFGYSLEKPNNFSRAIPFIYSTQAHLTLQGIKSYVYTPWGEGEIEIPLVGKFNLSNALAVITALCVYGLSFNDVLDRLRQLRPVPGRMQVVPGINSSLPLVVVDYAHTPDALENALQSLRAHTKGKLVCVFGCGGDRDPGKRPIMGKIAERLADKVLITNDNPRHEKPEEIAQQILRGFTHPEHVAVVLDRSKAIQNSIQWVTGNDCVLIAGKGAEHYQQIGDENIPFDDVEEVSKCMAEKSNVTVVK
jgi:UDP-N-acetylmuramoyl-L-alanyl-D-glutamate--2,6-diaminopimelate ligase